MFCFSFLFYYVFSFIVGSFCRLISFYLNRNKRDPNINQRISMILFIIYYLNLTLRIFDHWMLRIHIKLKFLFMINLFFILLIFVHSVSSIHSDIVEYMFSRIHFSRFILLGTNERYILKNVLFWWHAQRKARFLANIFEQKYGFGYSHTVLFCIADRNRPIFVGYNDLFAWINTLS